MQKAVFEAVSYILNSSNCLSVLYSKLLTDLAFLNVQVFLRINKTYQKSWKFDSLLYTKVLSYFSFMKRDRKTSHGKIFR